LNSGKALRPTCTYSPEPLQAGDDVVGIDGLRLDGDDARMHAQQTVGRLLIERPVVRDAVGEDIGDRHLECDREDIEAGEHILPGGRRAPPMPPRSSGSIDQIEDALFIELIRIIELSGDDAPPIGQRMNEGVDERLIVESDFAARRIA
jgi:hypothetical protein